MKIFLTLMFAFITTIPLRAQTPDYGKILVPVYNSNPQSGAYGSRWASELWVRNEGTQPILILLQCFFECGPFHGISLKPGESTTDIALLNSGTSSQSWGFLLTVPQAAETLRVNLRVRDLSRQALTWGTEIKTVKDDELLTGKVSLLPVPTDGRFRLMLRMYTRDEGRAAHFRVRFFGLTDIQYGDDDTEPLLAETVVSGSAATNIDPGYVEIPALVQAFPMIASRPLVRIEIEPIDPSTRYWAFVTVTNNETQHVTTVNP